MEPAAKRRKTWAAGSARIVGSRDRANRDRVARGIRQVSTKDEAHGQVVPWSHLKLVRASVVFMFTAPPAMPPAVGTHRSQVLY